MVTLGDVAAPVQNAIVDGPFGSNLKLVDYVPEGVPVLQGKNITDDTFRWFDVRFISSRKAEELKRSSVRVGDILIVKIGSIGYSAILDDLNGFDHAIIPANLAKVTPNLSKVDLRYLHRWLTSTAANNYLVRAASKTAQPALSLGKIKGLPVPLPPLAEQKRIAGILDAADALRAKRREALAQLDTLLQSTFLDMFGDPVTNPMGWEVVSVGDEISFLTSGSRGWARYYAKEGDTFIRIQNLKGGQLDLDDSAFVNAPESAEAKRTTVEPGDVLLSITADLGRTAVVPGGIAKAHINQHLAILRFTSLNPVFVSYQLASKGGQAQFNRLNREGVKAGLNFNDVKSIRLTNPPLNLQHRFAAIVESVERQKASQHAHLAELDTLFTSLQSRAFRGDL